MSQQHPTRFLARRDRPLILYVIQQQDYSGAEMFAVPLMRADADPLLACPPGSRTEELATELGIPTVPLAFRSLRHSGGRRETIRSVGRGLASARDLRRILRRHPERTIVYCSSLRPAMLAALARPGLRRRTLWALTDFLPPAPLRGATRALALVGCDRAAALSEAVASDFAGRRRALAQRVTVVYPGVDAEASAPDPEPHAPRAAVVGAISPTKRTDLAVDVAARVAAEVPGFELRIVGRAQYRDEDYALEAHLHRRVEADPTLREAVYFDGYATDVPERIAASSVLLHCRPDEPFGIVLLEAMAAGLPVVAPDAAGPREIVQPGVTGLLYPPGDAAAAAECVIRLLRAPDEARRMGQAGRARVLDRFSERAQVAAADRLLELVADGRAPATSS